MPKILIYNSDTNKIETYDRNTTEPMPYSTGRSLTVGEFMGSSNSNLIWTSKQFMQKWNKLRLAWGKPIYVGYAFKRIWQGGHAGMSQHYAGMAIDMGQTMTNAERNKLRNLAIDLGIFGYVEPASLTPTWVHVDGRTGTPACPTGGYPLIKQGSRGVYVMVLQDALTYIGYNLGNIDGIFGAKTKTAVQKFQKANGLSQDGIVGCNTWRKLTNKF